MPTPADTSLAAALAFDATVASARARRVCDRPYPHPTPRPADAATVAESRASADTDFTIHDSEEAA